MIGQSRKLRKVPGGYLHWCPGCKTTHVIYTKQLENKTRAVWDFNKNFDLPSFSPSVLIRRESGITTCHYYLKAGQLQFLGDCLHPFASKVIDLPDIPGHI